MARIIMRVGLCLVLALALASIWGGQAPAQGRPTRAHQALALGIERARSGDYDHALRFFEQAKAGMEDLNATEQRELLAEMQKVQVALQASGEGAAQLQRAEQALQANRTQEALAILKELSANQYLRPDDKRKAQQLSELIQPQSGGAVPARTGAPNPQALTQARTKLRQARTSLGKEDYDLAEVLAKEALALNATYTSIEDTPQKVLDEIAKARVAKLSSKDLMSAARAALQRGDLDRADQLAQDAKKAESFWTVRLWGDSPGKIQKDIQAARARQVAQAKVVPPPTPAKDNAMAKVVPPPMPAKDNAQVKVVPPPAPARDNVQAKFVSIPPVNDNAQAKVVPPPRPASDNAQAKVVPPPTPASDNTMAKVVPPPTPANDNAMAKVVPPPVKSAPPVHEVAKPAQPAPAGEDDARVLVRQGRRALDEGRHDDALELARRAAKTNASFHWWDVDNPSKLMADAHKARNMQAKAAPAKTSPTVKTPVPPVPGVAGKTDPKQVAKTEAPKTDPRAQLREARELMAEGKLDEARELCQKAQLAGVSWGLFEDTPSKLLAELGKAQAKRDKDDSVKALAEARKLYEEGKHDEAEKLTFRAEKLHGPYSVWDFGDRPQKLRGEIEVARAKGRKLNVPPVPEAIAQRESPLMTPIETVKVEAVRPETVASDKTAPTEQRTMVSNPPRNGSNTSPLSGGTPAVVENIPPALTSPLRGEMPSGEKQRALLLLANARRDMDQGRLLDARQKAIDAQKVNVSYGLDEDRPERLLLELSAACNRQVESLLQQATDGAAAGGNDAARVRKAEQDLAAARQLASGFGQDTQNIDNKIAWLKSLQAVAEVSTPAPTPATTTPGSPTPGTLTSRPSQTSVSPLAPVQHQEAARGHELLDRARLELKKGELSIARRLAEEAFSGGYGVEQDAARVLSTLDAEEENQRILASNRTFELLQDAFRQKDYPKAKVLVKSVDPVRLTAENKSRFRDIMQSASMHDNQVAQAPRGSGTASVDDKGIQQRTGSSKTFQEEVAAMQDIEFQMQRSECTKVRQEATRLFPTAPTRAVEILQTYKSKLESSKLEQDYVSLLKRQIDAQLQQFQTLKAQTEFRDLQNQQAKSAFARRTKEEVAKQDRSKQVSDLMRDYNSFRKQGKYREAEMAALKAHELDPDNAVLDAAVYTARILRNQAESDRNKMEREDGFVRRMGDAEKEGAPVTSSNPMIIDREASLRARQRGPQYGIEAPSNPKNKALEERMSQPINIEFRDGTPLNQVVEDLQALSGLNIVVDTGALDHEGIDPKQPLSGQMLQGISLKSALNILLRKVTGGKLTHIIRDEVLYITTEREARGKLLSKTYQVADVVIPVQNYMISPSASLMHQMQRHDRNNVQMNSSTYTGPNSLGNGMPAGTSSTGGLPGLGTMPEQTPSGNQPANTLAPGQSNTMEEMLIKLITNTIAPNTWASVGGPGTIEYFPLGMALIINQTPDVQEQIGDLLNALRRLQDLEVSVEVRMISLEEAFFERIGLDFDINIDPKVPPRAQEQIVTQQFAPINQVNYPRFNSVIAGLQPAGSAGAGQGLNALTSDLHVPLQSSSFQYAIPPFGGFPGIPGANGGLSMGLAFLSDIQVFMFMEAAQGNRRTNVMQAPKLTLFNGQTATIQIQDFQWFVTNVQVVQASGQVVFVPQNQPIPLGVNLAVQAVVSADRRFVRLNLSPTLTNLASATVPLFPITTFITPVFEGGAQGQPVPFTQFIQQPTFTLVTIQTTVSVPDGGTVLLGGLKLLNEGRNEFGPPILSKIPYLSRLWKNVGYGRDTSSLLIMVTPRIIINEEEEEIQANTRAADFR